MNLVKVHRKMKIIIKLIHLKEAIALMLSKAMIALMIETLLSAKPARILLKYLRWHLIDKKKISKMTSILKSGWKIFHFTKMNFSHNNKN